MSKPLTPEQKKIKRKFRRRERDLLNMILSQPVVQDQRGRRGFLVPFQHDPSVQGIKAVHGNRR